ncbi:1,2-phenylacetyl-CoA epoxidase subunit PaaE [Sphingomonas sp. PP-CC-3G-468]|uniref:1,2-phenylacetyl-CoA epoxidase subunit PaaE n=1 Tax=Sphingomonas sp. PP-CC-3G-468 TaxID=2135656 RepID=UPI001047BB9C|nr:1,2-phenylacetyl-CoA epoxidase subunit PaaE [Sphingomonas sp. PP-CC-3G-468]TCM02924.1 ring-1,2-phenylacetyl-CoA epoxidase subunit PaaE [Sphingomonas sp. PP-CC-3G-468]
MTKTDFHPLRVAEVRRETSDAVSIRFEVPDALRETFAFTPGQYLTLRRELAGDDVRRNYSVCAAPHDGELRVAVKMLAGGRFSAFANETLKPGDEIEVMPASGHFTATFSAERTRQYAAFAAGSGITPILSLIKTALAVEPDSRFTLFYGNRMSSQVLFLEELSALKNRFMGRLEIFHFLTMEEEDVALFNGRLDRAKCDEILATLIDPAAIDLVFACGPEGMMEAAEQALLARGVAKDRILLERFTSAGSSAVFDEAAQSRALAASGRRMGVVLDGRKLTVAFDSELGNILDSVRAAGAPAPYACKGGVCATCRAKVLTGTVEMRLNYGLTDDEVAQGYVLTCQSTPTTDDVVVSYDA